MTSKHVTNRSAIMNRSLSAAALSLCLSCSSGSSGGAADSSSGGGSGSSGHPSQGGVSGVIAASADAGTSGGGSGGASGSTGVGGAVTAGAAGAPSAAGGVPNGGASVSNGSVTQRGGDSARTSHWLAPSLTKANLTKLALDANFKANFAGEFASSPLFLTGATPGAGRFYVATTENDVFALDETSGATVWQHNIGGYRVDAPTCGGKPNHHGILSTPVIDEAAGVIYVAAAMTDNHHEIHALSVNTGMEVTGWPVNLANIKSSSGLAFNAVDQNQRSALSLVNGILYVAFGGYCGDGGNYRGWVVAVSSKDPTEMGAWATMDKQGAVWAPGGMASDGNGLFAVTGNNSSATGTNHSGSDSEEILRLTDLAVPHRDNANLFLPAEWSNPMNTTDRDFGASSPAVITVPNSTPSTVIVAPSKPGRVYFLDAGNLGGEQGQFAEAVVASTTDQSLYTAPSAYQAASGVHVAISTGVGSMCPNGGGDANVMSILMQPGVTPDKPPMPKISWCAKVSTGDTVMRSPISTNSAGNADPIVWMINGDKLNGFDGETGALLYDSGAGAAPSSCSGVAKFTAPVAVNGRIVTGGSAGGQSRLCSWSVH
jgi:hypothetical protein